MSGNSTGRVPAMTANGLTAMFLGEKKNRASKTALLNLSFSRAVRLPFAIILLCDRVETNSINPVSQGKVTGQKPCIHAGLRRFDAHSHSIVPDGFGVKSYSTRLTPCTSVVIRSVICCSKAKGTSSTAAVIASIVFTARRITGHS